MTTKIKPNDPVVSQSFLESRLNAWGEAFGAKLKKEIVEEVVEQVMVQTTALISEVMEVMAREFHSLRIEFDEMKKDITVLKTDVKILKADVVELKADVTELKLGFTELHASQRRQELKFDRHVDQLTGNKSLPARLRQKPA